MHKMLPVFAAAVLLAGSIGFASSPHTTEVPIHKADQQVARIFDQIQLGMPFSQIGALGINTTAAERVAKSTLRARFMPKDAASFNRLDPAVKNCYRGPQDCTAYIFDLNTSSVWMLVQNGRVTWKLKHDLIVV